MKIKPIDIRISPKNSKLGKIPNISLIPVKDCGDCDHCMADCYALKAWRQYPAVRKAWKANSDGFRQDIGAAMVPIYEYLEKKSPKFFRIHVAGDFLSQEHVDAWIGCAEAFENTKFLAFTKMDLDFSAIPDNLTIIYSQWPGREISSDVPGTRAWVQDGTETRIPADAIECPGHCDDCGMCWNLPAIGKDVFFYSH